MHDLGNSEVFHITRQTINFESCENLQNFIVPEQLRHALEDIEALADLADAKNDISIAEVAYNRAIDWYRALGPEVKQPRQNLLRKVGRFYEKTGQKDQAELCYSKIFEDLSLADYTDIHYPLHHAIRNFNPKDQLTHDALMGIIRCCPPCRFKLRNGKLQTPLYLAVYAAKEEAIVAIMVRLRDPRRQFRIDSLHLDARDSGGQTILTTAILSMCSLPLINSLIKYGSNVNPEIWDGPYTPLQAASIPGSERIDVACLLILHHANPDYVFRDSTVAELMANNGVPERVDVPLFPELDPPPDA